MEKQIMDILNVGIGLLQAGKDGVEKAKVELEKTYQELSTKGAADTSEAATKVRESVNKLLGDIKDFSSVAGKNYDETRSKIIDNYNKITEEIQSKMPEGKIDAVKAKIQEVADNIKKTKTT